VALSFLENCCLDCRSVRVQFSSQAVFERMITTSTDDRQDISRINAFFHTRSIVATEGQPLDLDVVLSNFNDLVDNFTKRGSGYILAYVERLTVSFVRYRPLGEQRAGSFITTPKWLRGKHAVINVKNSDDRCFIWSILAALYPAKKNSDRLSNYLPYEHCLDTTGLEFPMAPNKIHVFERHNPTIAVHCLAYDSESKSFSVLYLSPEIHKRQHAITLLLLDSPLSNGFEKKTSLRVRQESISAHC